MTKEGVIKVVGEIEEVLPNALFKVMLWNEDEDATGVTVLAHIAGKMRRHQIRITKGDIVEMEMSPYDLTKGRIVFRRK